MKLKKLLRLTLMLGAMTLGSTMANASSGAKGVFDIQYPTAANTTSCFICHTGSPGPRTAYGNDYVAAGGFNSGLASAMVAIENFDSDGDGTSNIDEINAGTIAPVSSGTASTTGCLTTDFSTPLMMLLAILTLGLFMRKKSIKL